LEMLGYDISWAAFNIIEVMSSSKFTYKRTGYLCASQSFHEGLDILMLTTNMIRKDLCSMNLYDAGVALSGFSCFVSQDLARDLANDVMSLLVSTKPYIRKRAVLLMYKIFLKFPEALRPAFPRLREKLEDSDPGVQSAAVNVICELARKNPKNYLSLAPLFFKLMTNSTNNWMLIKIIKLFGALCPLEPRLGKKLLEPLTNLIHSTSAMSLLYECVNTVIAGLPNHQPSIQLCVSKLRILLEDPDQNLKYLALLSMSSILKTHPKIVQQHKDIIIQCLEDKDESIRLRALDLIVGMVSKKNIMDIVKKLTVHIDKTTSQSYRDELLSKIILICSQSDYHYVGNFEWYIDVLVQLTRIEGTRYGRQIASQMMDVTIRVKAIRPYAVQSLSVLLDSSHLLGSNVQKNGMCEVLYAAAWLSGEFCEQLADIGMTLESLLRSKVTSLPGHIQAVYVQSIAKIYANMLNKMEDDAQEEENTAAIHLGQKMVDNLPMFVQSADLEVQERVGCIISFIHLFVCSFIQSIQSSLTGIVVLFSVIPGKFILQMIKYVLKLQAKGVKCGEEVCALFVGEMNPVAVKAQKKVPLPEGLDLDKWINEPLDESSAEEDNEEDMFAGMNDSNVNMAAHFPELSEEEIDNILVLKTTIKIKKVTNESNDNTIIELDHFYNSQKEVPEIDEEELEKRREQRKADRSTNPHYLRLDAPSKEHQPTTNVDDIPVANLDLPVSLKISGISVNKKYKKTKKRRNEERRICILITSHFYYISNVGRHGSRGEEGNEEEDLSMQMKYEVLPTGKGEMPEGIDNAPSSGEDPDPDRPADDPHRLLNIDIEKPLESTDVLPVRTHRVVSPMDPVEEDKEESDKETKSKKRHSKKDKDKKGKHKHSKKDKDEKKKSSHKHKSHHHKKEETPNEPDLMINGDADEAAEVAPSSHEPAMDDAVEEAVETKAEDTAPVEDDSQKLDDMDFWLSAGNETSAAAKEEPMEVPSATPESAKTTRHRDRKSSESKEHKKKKDKKDKKEKKKGKRHHKSDQAATPEPEPEVDDVSKEEIDEQKQEVAKPQPVFSTYKVLAENISLKLTYETRVTAQNRNQLVVSIVFSNLTELHVKSMEFNVLDSLNTKLIRPIGCSSCDSVPVPFHLLPGSSNEGQFAFTVENITMQQKLRGTLTYMIKVRTTTGSPTIVSEQWLGCHN
ncbi:hypothetical protein QZH41_017603, partial [Actinostola sp. cb2023]